MEIKVSYSQIIFSGKLSLDCSLRTSTISLVPICSLRTSTISLVPISSASETHLAVGLVYGVIIFVIHPQLFIDSPALIRFWLGFPICKSEMIKSLRIFIIIK